MAFYHQAPGKKKKVSYGDLGSWDEEGSHYRDGRNKSKPERTYSEKKRGERPVASGRANPKKGPFRKESRIERNPDYAPKAEVDFRDYEYRGKTDEQLSAAAAEPENILCGRNPIREALKNDRDIEKLLVQKGELSGTAREIIAMAREKKVMVQEVEKSRLDEITHHHQGLIAFVSAYQYSEVEDILQLARERGEAPFIILLDSVTDPHNLGAIIRTAECTGAHGVIVPMHRSVPKP